MTKRGRHNRIKPGALKRLSDALGDDKKIGELLDDLAPLKRPRYDHRSMMWVVEREGRSEHRFDTQSEAEDYYNEEKDK